MDPEFHARASPVGTRMMCPLALLELIYGSDEERLSITDQLARRHCPQID
jgi:hypothetical protein